LLIIGVILAVAAFLDRRPILFAAGVFVAIVGVAPLVAGARSRRNANRLGEHARREDEILEAASRIAAESVAASPGREALAVFVAADRPAADAARRECLRRAAGAQGEDRDTWLDAANEIGHLLAPEQISSS
jgi:hypothetical protein